MKLGTVNVAYFINLCNKYIKKDYCKMLIFINTISIIYIY